MEGAPKAGGSGKAILPVPAGIDSGPGAAKSSARAARKARSLPANAEEDDDEQVEMFYALLANIRALRGASGSVHGAEADGVDAGGGGGATKKRLRGSEPPWTPAFRLEDFEEPSPAASGVAKRTRRQQAEADGEGSGAGVRVRRLGSGGESV